MEVVKFEKGTRAKPVREWCAEYCIGGWRFMNVIWVKKGGPCYYPGIIFYNKADAVTFKMTWEYK